MALREDGLNDIQLHLPSALRDRAEEMAARQCLSLNLFIATAVAEKLQRLQLGQCLDTAEHDERAFQNPDETAAFLH
jgi:hypothetical protein